MIQKKKQSIESKEKLHLGLDKHGNINLIRGKTTKEAKKAFIIRSILTIGSIAVNVYMIKNPRAFDKGINKVNKLKKLKLSDILPHKPVDSGIYSKELGRMMTVVEAFEAGYDLSD